jgi:aspartyl-tRNA synthetase
MPKKRKSIVTMMFVNKGDIHDVAIFPKAVLSIVILKRAPYAPINTKTSEYLKAIIIAKKKVLSPT